MQLKIVTDLRAEVNLIAIYKDHAQTGRATC